MASHHRLLEQPRLSLETSLMETETYLMLAARLRFTIEDDVAPLLRLITEISYTAIALDIDERAWYNVSRGRVTRATADHTGCRQKGF
jgi:hypothetical protein